MVRDVLKRLDAAADPERREFSAGYFPTRMRTLGVPAAGLRAALKWLKGCLEPESSALVLEVAGALVRMEVTEAGILAYQLLDARPNALELIQEKDLTTLGRVLDNWVTVDTFAVLVAGQAWRRGQVKDALMKRWARSSDRWLRRTAVVSTVALNRRSRGGAGDPKRTLAICELVARDKDDMVAKGLSWALRALAGREPRSVRSFLKKHGDRLAARVRREVRHKLETGLKNPRRVARAVRPG